MKNKHYNIFFTSERDGLGKSLRISRVSLFSTVIAFSALLVFAYIGMYRVFGFESITYELDQLREYKYVTSNLLIESGLKESQLNSDDLEEIIVNYIISNKMIYPTIPPVEGYVTKGVSKNNNEFVHAGLNIASKVKDEIKSPLDGLVVVANNDDSGGVIIIHHQNNFFTVYKNLEEIFVNARDLVVANQVIGILDDLNNESSHLYFEVWKDSQIIDPRDLISDYREKDVSIR